MMFATAATPRYHLTTAAKAIAINAIKHGHLPRSPAAAATAHRSRPVANRFGRKFLPIEADIPMPNGACNQTARPFEHMDCGESFFEPADGQNVETLIRRMKWDAKAYSPKKFGYEIRTENNVRGVRAWRIS